jgi:hypothetical protein
MSNPDSDVDELHSRRQTQPYLWNEPMAKVMSGGTNGFLRHIFLQEITANEANLDLLDLKYNPFQPRQAEVLLESKLNRCIDSLSRSKFIGPSFVHSYTLMLVKTSFLDNKLRKEIKRGLEIDLHLLVCVLKDVVDGICRTLLYHGTHTSSSAQGCMDHC